MELPAAAFVVRWEGSPAAFRAFSCSRGDHPVTSYADLRFYAELRDFLSSDRKSGLVTRSFDVAGSVKDMIESCGVPHTEVEVILANGIAVDFSYQVRDRDRISIYPSFRDFDVEPTWRVSPEPLPAPRFVLDSHLGKLARYLRLLGLDSAYDVEWTDPELVEISIREDRILLTSDRGLLMHGVLTRGYFVRAIDPHLQLTEVARRFDLISWLDAFTRCMACNGELRAVEKEEIADRLPPRTRQHYDDFRRCADCERIFWKGSHYTQLQEVVDRVEETLTRPLPTNPAANGTQNPQRGGSA